MRTKAIILDLDGVVVDSPRQKIPTDNLVSAIAKLKKTYYICAATGRVWSFAKPLLHYLKLTDPSIISAGTQICHSVTGEILWQQDIDKQTLQKVITIFQQYPQYKLLHNDGTEEDYFNGGVYPPDFSTTEPVYFLEQVFIPDAIALEVYDKLTKITGATCVMVVSQKPGCRDIHIVNQDTTKEQTIARLLKIIEVDKADTIGVGDGYNDIHLFNAVGRKIAMGNAVPELKKLADETIGSVKEDGLTDYFKQLLKNNS